MTFYCGMDWSARDCQGCVIAEDLSRLVQPKVRHALAGILRRIAPFKARVPSVVESTFKWYGLVAGRQEASYALCLAPTLGRSMLPGAKVKTDR